MNLQLPIKTTAGWRDTQASLRDKRLTTASAAEIAADGAGLDAIKAQWDEFMVTLKLQFNV